MVIMSTSPQFLLKLKFLSTLLWAASSSARYAKTATEMATAAYPTSELAILFISGGNDNVELDDEEKLQLIETVLDLESLQVQVLLGADSAADKAGAMEDELVMAVLEGMEEKRALQAADEVEAAVQLASGASRLVFFSGKESGVNFPLLNEEGEGLLDVLKQKTLTRLSVLKEKENGTIELEEVQGGELVLRCTSDGPPPNNDCADSPVRGSTIRAAYDEWFPIFYTKSDGSGFGGLMHDLLDAVAARLNLTIAYKKNTDPGIWGGKVEDPLGVSGMLGMLHRDEADITPAGYAASPERLEYIDFSANLFSMKYILFSQRATGSKVSLQNYFWEFDRYIWMCIAMTSLCLAVGLTVVMQVGGAGSGGLKNKGIFAASMTLRALINKGTAGLKMQRLSLKILVMVLFGFTTILFVSYRSCLNAFLAVVIPPAGIENLKDVLEKTQGITYWPGGKVDATFQAADPDSVVGKLYSQFLEDGKASLSNYEDGFTNVIDFNYVLLGESDAIMAMPAFTCELAPVKGFLFMSNPIAFALQLGSKYTKPFNQEVLGLINQVHKSLLFFADTNI